MVEVPSLRRVLESVRPFTIECSDSGEVALLLGTDNVARAIDREGRERARVVDYLPGDVLLHPDGERLIATRRGDGVERVTVIGLDGGGERSFEIAVVDDDPEAYDERYDPAEIIHDSLESMAEDLQPGWVGSRRDSPALFVQSCIDAHDEHGPHGRVAEQASMFWGPQLPIQSAVDPSGELLAVSAGDVALVSIDSGEVVRRIEGAGGVDVFALFDHGEAVHTLAFDRCGQLCTMGMWVSGNPFTRLACFDAASGRARSYHEAWSQTWVVEGREPVRLSSDQVGGVLPSELFPEVGYIARFLGAHVEIWNRDELVRTVLRPPTSLFVPQFCVAGFNPELVAAIVTSTHAEVRDLVHDRTLVRAALPSIAGGVSEVCWYQWSPARRHLAVVHERGLWLWAPADGLWFSLTLPDGAALSGWSMSADDRLLWLVDAEGGVWLSELPAASAVELGFALADDPHARLARVDPDDIDALLVCADALQDIGDPRGELIVSQHRGADTRELLAAHPELSANLYARADVELEWSRGFVRRARFTPKGGPELSSALALLGHESGQFLEVLELCSRADNHRAVIAWLERARRPRTLRSLELGREPMALPDSLRAVFPKLG